MDTRVLKDLTATLGYQASKIIKPGECDLNTFAVEQFFDNIQRPELSIMLTSDHIEIGFSSLSRLSQKEQFSELKNLIDYFFIYAFCTILTNDGRQRASEMVSRQGKNSSFDQDFLNHLSQITPEKIDSYPEIKHFLLHPVSFSFSSQFYTDITSWMDENPNPGASFLLRNYLHDTTPIFKCLTPSNIPNNHPISLWGRTDPLTYPLSETNVPSVVDAPIFYSDFNIVKTVPQIHDRPQKQETLHIPSISVVRAPSDASSSAFFSYDHPQNNCHDRPGIQYQKLFSNSDLNTNSQSKSTLNNDDNISDSEEQDSENNDSNDQKDFPIIKNENEILIQKIKEEENEYSDLIAYSLQNSLYIIYPFETKARKLSSHMVSISTLLFSPNGKLLLSGDVSGSIRLNSLSNETFGKIREYRNLRTIITCFAFTSLSDSFAVGTVQGTIYYFINSHEEPLRQFSLHYSTVTSLTFHQNCEYLASASDDGIVRLISITRGICVRVWKMTGSPFSMHFSYNGKCLLITLTNERSGSVVLLNPATGDIKRTIKIEARTIDAVFSPDEKLIAITDSSGGFSLWKNEETPRQIALTVLQMTGVRPSNLYFLNSDHIRVFGYGVENHHDVSAIYL